MDIEILHLVKKFGDNIILNNVNILFKSYEINCIVGTSGCGKTTLINILLGITDYDSGEIIGIENKKFSVVFQEDRLCENITPIKNIRLVCNKNITDEQIKNHLITVGLSESIYKPVSKLSGGMKRRVAIVRAVIYGGDIIIMDEPLKGLDDTTKSNVIEYIIANTIGKTLIIVTHDDREINKFKSKNVIKLGYKLS